MAQSPTATPKTYDLSRNLTNMLGRAVVGQQAAIQQLLITVLAGGHALIEGVPGTAKTLLVRALARCLGFDFKRVQLTPDLMPSDILGTNIFDLTTRTFHLRQGPIFTTILLADEINRAPAKTQSALLEGMQERQVTIDGVTHPLDENFTVFATQNPIEFEGTYPLPEAQLDRFMLKIEIDYLSEPEENQLLSKVHQGFDAMKLEEAGLEPVVTAEDVRQCRQEVLQVTVDEGVLHYIGQITRHTRDSAQLVLGCSPRASVMLLRAAKALAALRGQDYLTPDEVKAIAPVVLRHRLILRPEAEIEGTRADDIIQNILAAVPVPR